MTIIVDENTDPMVLLAYAESVMRKFYKYQKGKPTTLFYGDPESAAVLAVAQALNTYNNPTYGYNDPNHPKYVSFQYHLERTCRRNFQDDIRAAMNRGKGSRIQGGGPTSVSKMSNARRAELYPNGLPNHLRRPTGLSSLSISTGRSWAPSSGINDTSLSTQSPYFLPSLCRTDRQSIKSSPGYSSLEGETALAHDPEHLENLLLFNLAVEQTLLSLPKTHRTLLKTWLYDSDDLQVISLMIGKSIRWTQYAFKETAVIIYHEVILPSYR